MNFFGARFTKHDLAYLYDDWQRGELDTRVYDPEKFNDPMHRLHILRVHLNTEDRYIPRLSWAEFAEWRTWLMTHELLDIPCDYKRFQVNQEFSIRYTSPSEVFDVGMILGTFELVALRSFLHRLINPRWSFQWKKEQVGLLTSLWNCFPESLFVKGILAPLNLLHFALWAFVGVLEIIFFPFQKGPGRFLLNAAALASGAYIVLSMVLHFLKGHKATKSSTPSVQDFWDQENRASDERLIRANIPYPEKWKVR